MIDINKFRPRRDWVLVLDDPRRKETNGGIILPGHETGIEKVTEGTGTIVAVGPGEKNDKVMVHKGLKIVYRSFLKHAQRVHPTNIEYWENREEKIYFLMNVDDVLGVVSPGVDVGVFSGRPQVPEGK